MDDKTCQLLSSIAEETTPIVHEWSNIVENLGINAEQKGNWYKIFKNTVLETYDDLLTDVKSKQNNLIKEIEELLVKSETLCKQLQIVMPPFGNIEKKLYAEKQNLLQNIQKYESMIDERKVKVMEIRKTELSLCEQLGKNAKDFDKSLILSSSEINDYEEYIENLENEVFQRNEIFSETKAKILELVKTLEYTPDKDFEKTVCNKNSPFIITNFGMYQLQEFYDQLSTEKNKIKEKVDELREKIRSMATLLEEDVQHLNTFLEKTNRYTYTCLRELETEYHRLEKLKQVNIQTFVEKLRDEIKNWWEKCRKTDEQRKEFRYMNTHLYSEDLLSLHDIELNKLKTYYKENSKIFNLLEKRDELWAKMMILEAGQTTDRFKNRAGQLLQEEKERNKISIQLPKIEEQLLKLANEYEESNGTQFLSFGCTIEDIIKTSHEKRNHDKRNKAAKRKQEVLTANSTSTQKFSLFTSQTPGTSYKKSGLYTPSAKKMKTTDGKENASTAPAKLTSRMRKRLSVDREKRIEKCRKAVKLHLKRNNNESKQAIPTTYNEFEQNLSEDCRSTLGPANLSPLAEPLPKTPSKPSRTLTPKKLDSKSPNSKAKFSATTGLKLLF